MGGGESSKLEPSSTISLGLQRPSSLPKKTPLALVLIEGTANPANRENKVSQISTLANPEILLSFCSTITSKAKIKLLKSKQAEQSFKAGTKADAICMYMMEI